LADQLKKALTDYTESGGEGKPVFDQEEAVAKMLELYEICAGMFHGFDYSKFKVGSPKERITIVPPAIEHVLKQDNGKERLLKTVTHLSKAFALSVPNEKAIAIRDDVGFFQTVRSALAKTTPTGGRDEEELNAAVRQIVSRAVASDQVIDIFSAAGLKTPDISILSDEFLAEVKDLPQRNLAFEVLKKLLNDEIKVRSRKNLVQSRLFSQMLEEAIRKYQNRAIEAAQIIQELIDLAKGMREASKRGEDLGFTEEELAFYDALEVNDSAVKVLGDDTLKTIARELVDTVHKNTTIDWTVKESVKAKLRTMVKRILRKYGYPPDKQEKATQTVLEQAELLCKDQAA
jgi:type I restriction enzyme R subunit